MIDRKEKSMLENTRPSNPKTKWILAGTICVFAALGTFLNLFSLIGFAIFVYAVAFGNSTDSLVIIVFTMSFANIFKTSPSAQSLFTYILLGYVVYKLILGHGASNEFWLTFVVFVIFAFMQCVMSINILRTIKFFANFLFIYFALQDAEGHEKDVFLGYTAGVISASAVSWLKILPDLEKYMQIKSTSSSAGYKVRFAGMYSDPNYYSVNIIIAFCLVVILHHRKDIKSIPFALLSLCLIFFSVMTYSKSAILMLAVPVLLFLYSNSKNRRYFLQIVCFLGLFIFALYVVAGKVDFLATVMERFRKAENLNQLTTGRVDLWQMYLRRFSQSAVHLVVGNGFGAKLVGGAAHNTYLDMIYYLGIAGTALMLRLLYVIILDYQRKIRMRTFLNTCVILVIAIMYFFLSMLFYFDLAFHLLLAIMVLNMDTENPLSHQTARI